MTEKLRERHDLSPAEAATAARALAQADVPAEAKKAFLIALHAKGESVAEVTAFAEVFRALALDPGLSDWREQGIDIVGTGGSGHKSFNVSSVTALVVASAGVPVLKHGNRAITSQSGSADFLAALGLPIQTDPERLRRSVEELRFCFFFAPAFHPAFKEIMPVRKELAAAGQRTVFNILGPLINPAQPRRQLLGVFSPAWVRPLADSLTRLGLARGLSVHGDLSPEGRVDELTTAGENRVAGMGDLSELDGTWSPEEQGFVRCLPADLRGGTPAENVRILEAVLEGHGPHGLVDTLCLNAGAALRVAGVVPTWEAGFIEARRLLLGGTVKAWLQRARRLYAEFPA